MDFRAILFSAAALVCITTAAAEEAPPAAALRYHTALLARPHNQVLFDRFHDAWIDSQPLDSLEAFLTARAENQAGTNLVILARFQLRRGHADAALATLGKAITALPEDPALPLERAKILLTRLDFPAARADLEAVVSGKDEALAAEAVKLIGKSHLREGDPAAAIQAWDKLLAKHPGDEDMLEDLVELAAAGMQTDQALAYADKLITATSDPYKKAQRRIRRGELLAASGKNDEAIALWSETLAQTGEGSWLEREIIDRISRDYRRQDRVDALVEKFAELAEKNPRRLLIHRELARLEAASGELDSAIGRFREVLRRSPGEADLREEFIRLLIDGERFQDAADELEKMITRSPEDAELHLRMADLAHRRAEADPDREQDSPPPPAVLASLEKAHGLLGSEEPAALRIASLMFGYGLEKEGEALLESLLPSVPAAEALAAHFTRTERKKEALALLEKISATADRESVLRATTSIASLGQPETAFRILLKRQPEFPANQSYLAALAQFSLAAKNPADGIDPALDLLRLAKLPTEIRDAVKISTQLILAAEETEKRIATLTAENPRTTPRTCLLASLLESQNQQAKADALFEKTEDPALLRFHASLLALRNDLPSAIAVFERLGASGEGGKVSFFKDLSELQLRAGQTTQALETLEQWRTAAPTDKAPWTIAAQLLRETGKISEAMDMTRRALVRFSGDEDLSLSLARLLMDTGETDGAEQIYWRLYDNAPDPSAHSRIAQLLAALANRTGGTEALKEKFLERARGNSRSLGPVLALVEIARASGDRDGIREHLSRALVIQPENADVRIQLAELEQQTGNADAQIEILSQGISKDPKGRLRSALAQAYIQRGDTMKGMRILRALAGEKASDPRAAESTANSLATSGLYAEAIAYLQESLPDGGDWHSQFLLAHLLQEDGRKDEAAPIFLSLLDAEKEIPGLHTPTQDDRHLQYYRSQHPALPGLMELIQAAQAAARINQRHSRHSNSQLPATPSQVRTQSLIRLALIAASGNTEVAQTISTADIPELPFVIDLVASFRNGTPDYATLLEKHPARPGLFLMASQTGSFGSGRNVDTALLERILTSGNLDPSTRFTAANLLINAEPGETENWDILLTAANQSIEENALTASAVCSQLVSALDPSREAPQGIPEKIKTLLLDHASKIAPEGAVHHPFLLDVFAFTEKTEQWIATANSMVASHRQPAPENPVPAHQAQSSPWSGGYWTGSAYPSPNTGNIPLTSIPPALTYRIITTAEGQSTHRRAMPANDLLAHLESIDSPLLRAFIAIRSGDEKAISQALSADHPPIEETDFALLRATREIQSERYPEALRIYAGLRDEKFENPTTPALIDYALITLAQSLKPGERPEFSKTIHAALFARKPTIALQAHRSPDYSFLAKTAQLFGFTDLVTAFTPRLPTAPARTSITATPAPAAPARIATPPPGSRQPGRRTAPTSPVERFQEFARDGKNTAAARELLQQIRKTIRSGSDPSYTIRSVEKSLTPEIRTELISLADPGDTPGLTKHREYIEICLALGEKKMALATLEALAAERPFDGSITSSLAILLPAGEKDRAVSLLTSAAESGGLTTALNDVQKRFASTPDNETTFAFFELLVAFLERCESELITPADISPIANLTQNIFSGNWFHEIPSVLSPPRAEKEGEAENPAIARHAALARNFALTMLRHPALAETGFRYLHAVNREEKPADLDQWARAALLGSVSTKDQNYRYSYTSNGSSDKSSALYLITRLTESPAPADLFPPDYLAALRGQEPLLPPLLDFLSNPPTAKGIEDIWKAGAAGRQQDPVLSIFQASATNHATSAPGANAFFLSRLREISPEERKAEMQSSFTKVMPLLEATLKSSAREDRKSVQETCEVLLGFLFGEDAGEKSDPANNQAVYALQRLLQNFQTDPLTCVRIVRALDEAAVPFNNRNWIQSCFQELRKLKAEATVDLFASLGFLNKASSWEPFALHTVFTKYDQITGEQTKTITRTEQLTEIFQYVSTSGDFRKETIALLENRKPQTFGSLLTASVLASGAERERLATAAFRLAAPDLTKLPDERLDDFGLFISYLPQSATASLPPRLRAKANELNEAEITKIVANIDAHLEEVRLLSTFYPSNINGYLTQLATFDVDKSVSLFLKATDMHFQHGAQRSNNNSPHESALNSILSSIGSTNPETALRFYLSVIDSPQGDRFGICDGSSGNPFLATIGEAISRQLTPTASPDTNPAILPWLAAESVSKDFRNDALAAVACSTLSAGNRFHADELLKIFGKSSGLSKHTRDFALAAISIKYPQNPEAEIRSGISKTFVALLADPSLSDQARVQLAISAGSRVRGILSRPEIVESIADIFATYCARDYSAVNPLTIALVGAIGREQEPDAALPHLKRINHAFWENANRPVSGGHQEIPAHSVEPLFQTALLVGDKETANRLFPVIQPALFARPSAILPMIQAGRFDFATALLPDDATPYHPESISTQRTPELEEKLAAFWKTDVPPAALLRFETLLLKLRDSEGRNPTSETTAERKRQLITSYAKNPPENHIAKLEILSVLATSPDPKDTRLSDEVFSFAATLDPARILSDWSGNSNHSSSAPQRWDLLCKSASARLVAGDGSVALSLCNALKENAAELGDRSSGSLGQAHRRFLFYVYPATSAAVSEKQTAGFAELITPLADLTFDLSEIGNYDRKQIFATLALCEFLEAFEGHEGIVRETLAKITNNSEEYVKRFAFPRENSLFFYALFIRYRDRNELPGVIQTGFLTEMLTRPGMAELLIAAPPALEKLVRDGFAGEVVAFPNDPQESLSKSGRVILSWHRAMSLRSDETKFTNALRDCLANIPDDAQWAGLRTNCKLYLVSQLLQDTEKKGKEEAAKLFDSILPEHVSRRYTSLYERQREALKITE